MRKEPKSKVLGVVEVKLDLSDPQIIKALQGKPGLKGEAVKGDPGPAGADSTVEGPPGKSIKGDPGEKGKKGDSIKGDPGPEGPAPSRELLKELIAEVLTERLGR